jgi:hypothetical protein
VERLLELQAQIVDPTNFLMFTGSQLTHTLQVLTDHNGRVEPRIIRASKVGLTALDSRV